MIAYNLSNKGDQAVGQDKKLFNKQKLLVTSSFELDIY